MPSFHDIFLRGKSAEKIQVSLKSDKNNGTLLEDRYTFFIISRSVLLRMRNVSDESCRESQNTFYFQVTLFSQNRAIDEIIWKNIVDPDRSQMTVCSVRLHKATNTLLEYVKIIALLLQLWLHKCTSLLHDTYIACLVVKVK